MKTRGVSAGITKVGNISQPLRAAETPGSGDAKAMISAVVISIILNTPRSLNRFISYDFYYESVNICNKPAK